MSLKNLFGFLDGFQKDNAQEQYNTAVRLFSQKKISEAIPWLEKAAKNGHADAQTLLGTFYLKRGDLARGFTLIKKAADSGLAGAEFNLSQCYWEGWGCRVNKQEALLWCKRAASKGMKEAIEMQKVFETAISLGMAKENDSESELSHKIDAFIGETPTETYFNGTRFFRGDGVKKDLELAAALFMQAAALGEVHAQVDLGYCYLNGLGIEKNPKLAVEWFSRAADQDDPRGKFLLAACILDELGGLPKDCERAFELFSESAEAGLDRAQYRLGICYLKGIGTSVAPQKAVEWLHKSAQQDFPEALCDLGLCYWNGWGVKIDKKKAKDLIHRSADFGLPQAIDCINWVKAHPEA